MFIYTTTTQKQLQQPDITFSNVMLHYAVCNDEETLASTWIYINSANNYSEMAELSSADGLVIDNYK